MSTQCISDLKEEGHWGYRSVVEQLLCMHKEVGSISSTTHRQKRKKDFLKGTAALWLSWLSRQIPP